MRHRLTRALMAVTLSGALVGGGTAIAHAATSSPSAKSSTSSSSSSSSSSNSSTKHNCPNM